MIESPFKVHEVSFRWYKPDEILLGKKMREHLKFALSYWHTLCAEGSDLFGASVLNKNFGGKDAMQIYKNKADAAMELMNLLSIDYFCFHDRDIAPEGATLAETNQNLDIISDYLKTLMEKNGKRLLWGTANCFYHPRYVHGAGTSPRVDVFAFAAAQIKKALDITVKLGGSGYVFWGGREGYETLLNTDMALEQDHMARLLHMAVEYGRKIGFQGDFYIEPKPKEPMKHQYDFDAATVAGFLRKYHLEKEFKLNIEANHATLAGHTLEHELEVARMNGMFGSIDANQGDPLLGWDTDQFPTNVYSTTLCMMEVLKAGGFTNGGLNFDAKTRRGSNRMDDIVYSYIAGMEAYALGLRCAVRLMEDGRLEEFKKKRYAGWQKEFGRKITSGEVHLEDLAQYAEALGEVSDSPESGMQEYLEHLFNTVIFE